MKEDSIIPFQHEGASTDTASHRHFNKATEANDFFSILKERLLDVNNWQQLSGSTFAAFQLCDLHGHPVSRPAAEGDHFRIDIPGPGNPSGDGYDWVQVEKIQNLSTGDQSILAMTVRPCTNPVSKDDDVAHFFTEAASSTFIVRKKELTVSAEVHGRNEKPNIKHVDVSDTIRNTAIALGGILGLSKIQWHALTDGMTSD